MIFYCIFKLLHRMYGWGEVTYELKAFMTILSGFEMVFASGALVLLCINYLPDIIKNWRKK